MAELLKRWWHAIEQFGLDTARLQNYCAIPYLMAVNSLFCFVCFYASREVQFRFLYGLIGFILCWDLILAKRTKNFVLAFLHWLFAQFLRSISVGLLLFSVHSLQPPDCHEQKAFFASLFAVCCLILSPLYHYHRLNSKLASFARKFGQAIKWFLVRFVIRPIMVALDWLKFLVLLRWLPMFGSRLRSWALALFDWLDARLFSPLCQLGRQLGSWLRYFLFLHWCADLWTLAKRILVAPILRQLGHLLDGFIYIFGCYWLKPLLIRLSRALGQFAMSTLRQLGRASFSLASLTFEHIVWPFLLLASDWLAQFGCFVHEKAGQPLVNILRRKYKLVEDLVLINVLGPVLKKMLDWLPQRNPFEPDSDHELDEFIPEMEAEGAEDEDEEEGEMPTMNSARLMLELPAEMSADQSSISSQFSIEEEERALASGLRKIDISESDSDTDAFLPSHRRRRRKANENGVAIDD